LHVFGGVFNSGDGVGYKMTGFDGYSGVVPELFSDFGPFGRRQDAAVEPLLFGFL
jgi:hypothetical protein